MAAARYLSNWEASVSIALAGERSGLKDVPAHQFRILEKMNVNMVSIPTNRGFDLILDALIGYGLNGPPRPPF